MILLEAVYGWVPPVIPTYTIGISSVDDLDRTLQDQTNFLRLLKDNLNTAQAQMKQRVDKHQSKREFEVGIGYFSNCNFTVKSLLMSSIQEAFTSILSAF
jgi:hypothetical protein